MDINTLRIAVTVILFVAFIGIVLWAYSSGSRKGFAEAAQLPFLDDEVRQGGDAGVRR
jgi:cytochrome c oxidase cbb3-type subunit 4